jgi:hypothetical protein
VLDEVIWGSDTPVIVGKLPVPLNSMQQVIFLVPPKSVPPIVLRRMLEANVAIARALNVPLIVRPDARYLPVLEGLLATIEYPVSMETLTDHLRPEKLEFEAVSSFIVLPGFGSRKRVADTLGNIPEQIAKSFDGNLVILHFDE